MLDKPGQQGQRRLFAIASLVFFVWLVSFLGFLFPDLASRGALVPRLPEQWWGVWSAAFFHADLAHLSANTVPLLIFLLLLQSRGDRHFYAGIFLCLTTAGLGLWIFGRAGAHIGASGLVFALFGLLLANAVFRRGVADVLIAAGVILGYWGLLFGLFPTETRISWDGHLIGFTGGILSSWWLSRWDAWQARSTR